MDMKRLLSDVEGFLAETGMGPTYLGKAGTGDSTLVARLREGGRVWPETEKKLRDFMRSYRPKKASAAQPELAQHPRQ